MSELAPLINDLALMLIVAGIVTIVFKKLKQPLVLGYVVAGFLVSPHMPYTASVVDQENIHLWADIGVMFLLFSLGLVQEDTEDGCLAYHLDRHHHLLHVAVGHHGRSCF